MKTYFIYSTLLVFAAAVAVNAQTQKGQSTQVSNALKQTIRHTYVETSTETPGSKFFASSPEAEVENFQAKMDEINKKIAELEAMKSKVNEEINQFFVHNIQPEAADALSVNLISTGELIHTYQKQAEQLFADASGIKKKAETQRGSEKQKSLQNAAELDKKAMSFLINASVINGKANLEKYTDNAETISLLLKEYSANNNKIAQINILVAEASRYMRIANEMRIEAEDLTDIAAKLGAMQNSDEKEFMALAKQNNALNMFGGNLCSN